MGGRPLCKTLSGQRFTSEENSRSRLAEQWRARHGMRKQHGTRRGEGMKRKVLITGGAGFVGSHLADALLELGHEVRIFDNFAEQVHQQQVPAYLSADVEISRGDIRDSRAVSDAVAGVDVIYHLAAAVGVGQSMY